MPLTATAFKTNIEPLRPLLAGEGVLFVSRVFLSIKQNYTDSYIAELYSLLNLLLTQSELYIRYNCPNPN